MTEYEMGCIRRFHQSRVEYDKAYEDYQHELQTMKGAFKQSRLFVLDGHLVRITCQPNDVLDVLTTELEGVYGQTLVTQNGDPDGEDWRIQQAR